MKALKIIGICFGVLIVIVIAIFARMLETSPETSVYLGKELPKKYLTKIRELKLLEEDETIQYFYSDGLFKIEEGMYFVTERTLTVYIQEWDEPAFQIPLEDIDGVTADYDDSFLNDSWIRVTTYDGGEVEFPLSSEKSRDKLFVAYLERFLPLPGTEPPSEEETPNDDDALETTRPKPKANP